MIEKYYGSEGRYTCNGFIPLPQKRRVRRRRSIGSVLGRLFIATVLVIEFGIIAWALAR